MKLFIFFLFSFFDHLCLFFKNFTFNEISAKKFNFLRAADKYNSWLNLLSARQKNEKSSDKDMHCEWACNRFIKYVNKNSFVIAEFSSR